MDRFSNQEALKYILDSSSEEEEDEHASAYTSSEDDALIEESGDDVYESDDEESEADIPDFHTVLSKDNTIEYSSVEPRRQKRVFSENIFRSKQGPPAQIESKFSSPFSCLRLFLDDQIVETIVISTNHHLNSINADWRLTIEDFWLWIGSLYYFGVMKGKNMCSQSAFNKRYGLPFLSECNNFLLCF